MAVHANLRTLLPMLLLLAGCSSGKEPPAVAPEAAGPPFADLRRVIDDLPYRGVMAEAQGGDWLLQNDRFSVAVRSLAHRGGFAISGGNVIDAAPNRGSDLVREIFTYLDDSFGRQAVYEVLGPDAREDTSGAVTLVARGHDARDRRIRIETRYTLAPGADHLEITTTVTHTGTGTLAEYELGDVIEWGRTEFFAVGPGHRLTGVRERVPFLLGHGEGTAYAWVSPEGDLDGPHGHIWSDPIVATVSLGPGETAVYVRRLVVERGSPSAAAARAWEVRGDPVGVLSIDISDGEGRRVGEARVLARDGAGRIMGWGESGPGEPVPVPVPAGRYAVEVIHPARGRATAPAGEVVAGMSVEVKVGLPEPVRVTLEARTEDGDRSPARWIFEGIEGTPDPAFGPGHRIEGAGNTVFVPRGKREVPVPPGRYRVVATRGPGYQAWQGEVDLEPGRTASLSAELPRLVPVEWVAVDLHVHSLLSPDSNVSPEDRARSLVCEGIDWFAATEHGVRGDMEAMLDTLELGAPLRVLPGEELTSSTQGHFSAFPLPFRPDQPRGGGMNVRGLAAAEILARTRENFPSALIQVNHPRAGNNGYLDLLGYTGPHSLPPGFSLDFELLEIVNGKNQARVRKVWEDWMGLLGTGRRIVGVGNSDSHQLVGSEAGYPRNYVLAGGDGRDDLLEAIGGGRVVVSNGPFIHFTLEGEEVGSRVLEGSGTLTGHVTVIAPSWVDVRRVSVYVNGIEESVFMVPDTDDPVRFDEDVEVNVRSSGFVIVRVEGDDGLEPVLPPLARAGQLFPVKPLAFTNPIWVDLSNAAR